MHVRATRTWQTQGWPVARELPAGWPAAARGRRGRRRQARSRAGRAATRASPTRASPRARRCAIRPRSSACASTARASRASTRSTSRTSTRRPRPEVSAVALGARGTRRARDDVPLQRRRTSWAARSGPWARRRRRSGLPGDAAVTAPARHRSSPASTGGAGPSVVGCEDGRVRAVNQTGTRRRRPARAVAPGGVSGRLRLLDTRPSAAHRADSLAAAEAPRGDVVVLDAASLTQVARWP